MRRFKPQRLLRAGAVLLMAWVALSAGAEARAIKWARAADALTLDPHSQNEGPTITLAHQIYEPLIVRDAQGRLTPALAEAWALTSDPLVWEFRLRKGVRFHDGSPFTADDVIFSYERAQQPVSGMRWLLASVDTVAKVDDHTIRIKTKTPNALLPNNLTDLFIMSKSWTTKANAVAVHDLKKAEEPEIARTANGTGPFQLVSREKGVRTVLKRNNNYWERFPETFEMTELHYLPIKADNTRIAALLSGEVDFVQDVPVQEIEKLKQQPTMALRVGPENRAIFLGMNVGGAELATSDVKGRNPFAEKRVRQAINMTVNRQAIQRTIMRGQSLPTGIIAPPGVNGYSVDFDKIPPVDNAKAKAMLAEAGYPDGFSVTLHCPNDRYVNDEAICGAIVTQLQQIGVRATLVAQPRAAHVPMIQANPPTVDFYLLGWGVPTFDSAYIFSLLYHTRTDKVGTWNGTRYSNPDVDRMIESLATEIDPTKRNDTIQRLWARLQDETIYVPIHIQTIAYAMRNDIDIAVDVANQPKLKLMKFKKAGG